MMTKTVSWLRKRMTAMIRSTRVLIMRTKETWDGLVNGT